MYSFSYFCEEKELYKRLYIQTSVLLYHCCLSSINGQVDSDICSHLEKPEQELILKFCERLADMEVTFNNVECAIKGIIIEWYSTLNVQRSNSNEELENTYQLLRVLFAIGTKICLEF